MGLQKELEKIRPEIRTDDYSMSIGEWINLYENDEVDVHPEFQRFFRWSDAQKTRLIESILLGIPIPPIFVSQRQDGVWDVIDGVQRLSTIYQFVGILKDEGGKPVEPLVLGKTEYLPSLEGKRWNASDDLDISFDTALRMYVKRAKLSVSIILRESDEIAKYELFQRLNTGGSQLSDQEIRNCILVQLNRDMFFWMRKLADYKNFRECTLLTERAIEQQYDLELVLRFLIFRSVDEADLAGIGDLGDFLTDRMIEKAQSDQFYQEEEERAFKQTFDILYASAGEDTFRRYDSHRSRFVGGFLVSLFEVFAIGLGHHLQINAADFDIEKMVKKFWIEEQPGLRMGSGVSASTRIPTTIPLGRHLFEQ